MASANISPTQIVCCEVVARLSGDVQLLHQELDLVKRLQNCYKSLKEQYYSLTEELFEKISTLKDLKESNRGDNEELIEQHIDEFIIFIIEIWDELNGKIDNNSQNDIFISFIEGSPLVPILEQIVDYVSNVTAYIPNFLHPHCAALFSELSRQVNDIIYPDMIWADEFEKSLNYVTTAIPCLINLFTIIDFYIYTPKYDTVASICEEMVEGVSRDLWKSIEVKSSTFLPTKMLLSLLRGELLGEPNLSTDYSVAPEVKNHLQSLKQNISDMANHVLELSSSNKPQWFITPTVYYSCTSSHFLEENPNYSQAIEQYPLTEMNVAMDLQLMPIQHPSMTQNKRKRRSSQISDDYPMEFHTQKHQTGTSLENQINDLQPIKVPRLAETLMKPFNY